MMTDKEKASANGGGGDGTANNVISHNSNNHSTELTLRATEPIFPTTKIGGGDRDEDDFFTDVRVCAGRVGLDVAVRRAHRLVLAAACPVLRRALSQTPELGEGEAAALVCFPDHSQAEVDAFLDVIYGRQRGPIAKECVDLLETCGFRFVASGRLEGVPVEPDVEIREGADSSSRIKDDEEDDPRQHQLNHRHHRRRKRARSSTEGGTDTKRVKKFDPDDDEDDPDYDPERQDDFENNEYDDYDEYGDEDGGDDEYNEDYDPDRKVSYGGSLKAGFLKNNNSESSMPRFSDNLKKDTDGLYLCPIVNCEYALTNREAMSNHVSNMHTKVACLQCDEKVRPKDIHVHRQRHHPEQAKKRVATENKDFTPESDEAGDFVCDEAGCDFKSRSREATKKHMSAHTKTPCDFCGKLLIKRKMKTHNQRRHTSGYVGRFECVECSLQCSLETELKQHLRQYHFIAESETSSCKLCKRMFGRHLSISRHEKNCVPPPEKRKKYINRKYGKTAHIVVPFDESRPNCCPFEGCDYTNEKKFNIRGHYISIHCKQKCPYCGVELNFYHMERHIIVYHTKQYKHICHVCSAGFFNESSLTNHMDETHIRELKYICEDCGKAFYSYNKMYMHKNKEHMNANRFRCDPCGKVYTCKNSLIKHLKRYHNGEGINELYKRKDGKYQQMRKFRHVQDDSFKDYVAKSAQVQSYFKQGDIDKQHLPSAMQQQDGGGAVPAQPQYLGEVIGAPPV